MNYIILFTALLPVAILAFYIYRKDKDAPEPTGQLVKAFFFGVLSAPLSLIISGTFSRLGLNPDEVTSVSDAIRTSFFGAAIPEEVMKFVMLWLILRKNRHFDQNMDGIVYAVCVSLGFAALENILYLFENANDFVSVGIGRAIFAVPGHFCDGILMGFYYSLVKFTTHNRTRNIILTLLAPILLHGAYDSILFIGGVTPAISGVISIVFLYFCFKMWKYAGRKVKEHIANDSVNNTQNL